ncbi:MAG: type II toxin-antitoxin system Phd/YefM family antitoxin [Verrucomicrobia bacterium]|jgi:antitoxin (DNA-binding transcriptional repressor) of toxin-antitoxin stability system|nr:type II toxin-antitoxin system Phd/YefM family antitoxin [Verrucomicrobiota bacterium]
MKTATVRELRTDFPRLEAMLREGEPIAITKRNRIVARLVPAAEVVARPDFRTRFGGAKRPVGAAERSAVNLLREDRGE